jgi:hypothetical protein
LTHIALDKPVLPTTMLIKSNRGTPS